MKRIAAACFVVLALTPFSIATPVSSDGAVASDLSALKTRIQILRIKGFQAIGAFFTVTGKKGGYRALFPPTDASSTEVQLIYANLYVAAGLTNGTSELVCTNDATRVLCGPPFAPQWRVEPKDANPTAASLAAWTQETEAALEPLWTALCKLAIEKTGKSDFCALPPA
jgi:hypothetical protein